MSSEPKNGVAPAPALKPGLFRELVSHRGFIPCLALLVIFARFHHPPARKAALGLRNPLGKLDKRKLEPYKFVEARTIDPAVLNTLGTDQYIQWFLQDAMSARDVPTRIISLFVTYYTGNPDQVPHVPEQCYSAGGGFKVARDTTLSVEIPALGENAAIPVKVVEFEKEDDLATERLVVLYTFNTNGVFRAGRRGVQAVVTNLLTKHAYFSKLEITFGLPGARASKEASIEAGERFLRKIVPVLVRDHWPDFEAAEAAASAQAETPPVQVP